MKVIETMRAALAKATFSSEEVKDALDTLLDKHKGDLGDVGYEPSTDTEEAIREVNKALDEADIQVEDRKAELTEASRLRREQPDDA